VNVVFLDLDGVLNSRAWWNLGRSCGLPWPVNQFDPNAVQRLNRLLSESGARVVLSSAWRTTSPTAAAGEASTAHPAGDLSAREGRR